MGKKQSLYLKTTPNGAVVYVRVSTDEQAGGPLNLANQEQKCRGYCDQKGYSVMQVFIDPGSRRIQAITLLRTLH